MQKKWLEITATSSATHLKSRKYLRALLNELDVVSCVRIHIYAHTKRLNWMHISVRYGVFHRIFAAHARPSESTCIKCAQVSPFVCSCVGATSVSVCVWCKWYGICFFLSNPKTNCQWFVAIKIYKRPLRIDWLWLTFLWFHRTFTLGLPRLKLDWSITSSWIKLAVCIISDIMATRLWLSKGSLQIKSKPFYFTHSIMLINFNRLIAA